MDDTDVIKSFIQKEDTTLGDTIQKQLKIIDLEMGNKFTKLRELNTHLNQNLVDNSKTLKVICRI